jgi:Ni/Co efflux regulator RcnB
MLNWRGYGGDFVRSKSKPPDGRIIQERTMKKATAILAALALAIPGTALAQGKGHGQGDDRGVGHGQADKPVNHGQIVREVAHRFKKGDKFDRRLARDYRVIDYQDYRALRRPPEGYRYVRSGEDILLISIASNLVEEVFTGLLR